MIDQAVYVPAVGSRPAFIAGVRGGYMFNFAPDTVKLQMVSRFCSPQFGDCALCYDNDNDKLIASFWNEQKSATGAGQAPATDTHDARGLYKINPATFSVELFRSSASMGATNPQGIHNLAYFNGLVYSGSPGPSAFNSTTLGGACSGPLAYYPIWSDVAVDTSTGIAYSTDPIDAQINIYLGSFLSTAGFNPYGICVVPHSQTLYVTARTGVVYWWQIGVSIAWTGITVGAALPYHIRYNPFDGLVYVPDVNGNQVFGIDPVSQAVVSQVTGLDSPIDVVFTPTNVFAVQQGLVGLKLIK